MTHFTWEQFTAWADGQALSDDARAHLRACEACSEKLAHFADIDMTIHAAANHHAAIHHGARRQHRQRWMLVAASLLAVMGAGIAYRATRSAGEILDLGEIICPDGDDQIACVANAQSHGLAVSYPPLAGAPILAGFQPLAGEYR